MNTERRNRNPPKRFFVEHKAIKPRLLGKKLRIQEENISVIGLPPKYVETNDVYLLPCNIPCCQRDDSFVTDFSWLNEFHVFKEVVKEEEGSLVIHVERRTDSRFPRLKNFVKRLLKLRKSEVKSWGKLMRNYYESCKSVAQRHGLIDQEASEFDVKSEVKLEEDCGVKLGVKGEYDLKPTLPLKTEVQGKYFKEKEGIIQLKSYFRGSESRLAQIIVNENLIKMLGFDQENFISQTLNEGLPEIFSTHDETNSQFLRRLLDELAEVKPGEASRKTSFLETSIKTKSGYVKKVKVQAELVFSYENNRFESDLAFHIINNEETPYYLPDSVSNQAINESFIREMRQREEEVKNFMQTYYSHSATLLTYSNLDKICRIKEI